MTDLPTWKHIDRPPIERAANKRGYTVQWPTEDGPVEHKSIISVTTALKTAYPPYLAWWGQKVGVQGTLALGKAGEIKSWDMTDEDVVPLLTEHKLTVNHVRDEAATRGTDVHAVLDAYGQTGEPPSIGDFPEEQRHFVAKLAQWLLAYRPVFHEQETATAFVGTGYLAYAGTFDGYATMGAGPHKGRTFLTDLKTSKSVYLSHHAQLAAYQYAERHLGMPELPGGIIHIPSDPASEEPWQFVESVATADDWLLALDFALGTRDLEKRVKKALKDADRPAVIS